MKLHRNWLLLAVILLLILAFPLTVSANSAEPPGMIIITTGLPEDAELTLIVPGSDTQPEVWVYRVDKVWESQYRLFYRFDMGTLENASLQVTAGGQSFICSLPDGIGSGYNNVLTLDYRTQSLTLGQNPWRQPLLTALRIVLTLLIEGLIFCLFGFRGKKSWIVFLIVNLLTQGWLNIVINSYAFSSGYWVITFVLMELAILAAESIAFPLLTREKPWWLCLIYTHVANAASLAAGILLIGHLPI